jgi:hypothetical protein
LNELKLEGGSYGRRAEVPKNKRRVEAQLRSASGRRSKLLKDADSIETVVEVPGRANSLKLIVHSGGGYSLRARTFPNERGYEAPERDLVTVGVLGTEEIVSLTPG